MLRKTTHPRRGFFVTGTDTGVGKTVISGAIVTVIQSLGLTPGVMKPIESGCRRREGNLMPRDGLFLKRLARMDDPISDITPVRYSKPLAPLAASELEERPVRLAPIRKAFAKLSQKYDAVVAEGIGGLMVPVAKDYFVIDLAGEFGMPLIIVSKPGLGTLNHTLLSVESALKRGLEVAGVIINFSTPPERSIAEKTNVELLGRILPVPLMGTFPYLSKLSRKSLRETALRNLDIDVIGKYVVPRKK